MDVILFGTDPTGNPIKLKLNADGTMSATVTGGGDASAANQATLNTEVGIVTEAAPATDTASSGLNGRLQRIAQRLTALIALLPTALGAGGGLKVDGSGTALPVAATMTDGADAAKGTTTVAAASSTVAEDATSRTGIGLWKGIKNILILLNAKFAAGANIGVVGGTTIEVTDEFARPADTTAYAVGDAIAAAVTDSGTTALRSLVVGAANGATGYLTKLRLMTDQSGCVAVIRVHFYTVAAPPTVIPGDNVAMGLAWANRLKRIGAIDLPALATELGTVTAARTQDLATRLAFQCDPADNKIYYRMETQTVFTPGNAQNWFLAATSERNAA